jgi:hypothetical protein
MTDVTIEKPSRVANRQGKHHPRPAASQHHQKHQPRPAVKQHNPVLDPAFAQIETRLKDLERAGHLMDSQVTDIIHQCEMLVDQAVTACNQNTEEVTKFKADMFAQVEAFFLQKKMEIGKDVREGVLEDLSIAFEEEWKKGNYEVFSKDTTVTLPTGWVSSKTTARVERVMTVIASAILSGAAAYAAAKFATREKGSKDLS